MNKDILTPTFDRVVADNLKFLKSMFTRYFAECDYQRDVVDWADNSIPITDWKVEDLHRNFLRNPKDNFPLPFQISFMLSNQARQFYSDGQVAEAWSLLSQARYFTGLANASLFELPKFSQDRENINARLATAGRSAKSTAAKEEAASLLHRLAKERLDDPSSPPFNGWASVDAAILAIQGDFAEFVRLKMPDYFRRPVRDSNLLRTWIRTDPLVRSAYNKTCAKSAKVRD